MVCARMKLLIVCMGIWLGVAIAHCTVVSGCQGACFCDRLNGRMMKRNRELICISLFGGGFQWVLGGKTVHKLLLICAMILLIKIYLMFTRTKYDIHVDLNMHTTLYICLEFRVN